MVVVVWVVVSLVVWWTDDTEYVRICVPNYASSIDSVFINTTICNHKLLHAIKNPKLQLRHTQEGLHIILPYRYIIIALNTA